MMFQGIVRASTAAQPAARGGQPLSHAVVLGGSLAGLLAARVLSTFSQRVTVIERDRPTSHGVRKSVPQGHHAHLLLRSGLERMETLFPGICDEFEAIAGPPFDSVHDVLWRINGRYRPRFATDYRAFALGRPTLEALVRQRVEALPNVDFAYGERAIGLSFDNEAIRGVHVASGGCFEGDLVVDASGRGTQVPKWLAKAGFQSPPCTQIELNLTYTSCTFRPRGDGFARAFRMMLVPPVPPRSRVGGLLLPLEDGCYVATLIAYGKQPAPRDMSEFLERAACVDDPLYRRFLEACDPEGTVTSFAIPRQEWHHYERLDRHARRLVVLGDAFCHFDPGYGQGMSVCALQACELQTLLRSPHCSLDALGPRYFRRAARVVAAPWNMARGRAPGASNSPSLPKRWLRAYNARSSTRQPLHLLCICRSCVCSTYKPAQRSFSPPVSWREYSRRNSCPEHEPMTARSSLLTAGICLRQT